MSETPHTSTCRYMLCEHPDCVAIRKDAEDLWNVFKPLADLHMKYLEERPCAMEVLRAEFPSIAAEVDSPACPTIRGKLSYEIKQPDGSVVAKGEFANDKDTLSADLNDMLKGQQDEQEK